MTHTVHQIAERRVGMIEALGKRNAANDIGHGVLDRLGGIPRGALLIEKVLDERFSLVRNELLHFRAPQFFQCGECEAPVLLLHCTFRCGEAYIVKIRQSILYVGRTDSVLFYTNRIVYKLCLSVSAGLNLVNE